MTEFEREPDAADLVIVGAGPAGLAAAFAAREAGVADIVIVERDTEAGGILPQCIHSGFGLRYFEEELTGPEYAERFAGMVSGKGIRILYETMALSVSATEVKTLSVSGGLRAIAAKAVVLAMGCRERTRPAIAIPGARPSGVMTAGLAQRYINIEGRMIGKKAVILGSGDIGLIMARRLTLEGAEVLACVEIMPHPGGLSRNIAQCLEDYNIPLLLSHTVTEIRGKERLSGVVVARVDENRVPVPGTEVEYACDTLLLSVGLIPENELSEAAGVVIDPKTRGPVVFDNCETTVPGIFACGNVVQVHDLVDFVSEEGMRAGKSAAEYIFTLDGNRNQSGGETVSVSGGKNVAYTVPQKIRLEGGGAAELFFRVRAPIPKADIVVCSGREEIRRIPRRHLLPGEMERVSVEKEKITGKITVSVETEEKAT